MGSTTGGGGGGPPEDGPRYDGRSWLNIAPSLHVQPHISGTGSEQAIVGTWPFEHVIADMLPRSVSVPNWAVVIPHRRKVAKGVEVRMLVVLWKKVDVEDV